MTLKEQAILSNYKELSPLNDNQNVWLVKDVRTSKILVKKNVVYNSLEIYKKLQKTKIDGIPEIYHIFEIDKNSLIIIEEYIHG